VVIIGPSGSGKSTLLRCVNQLEPADGGDLFFEGRRIDYDRRNVHLLRRDIGMVFQNFELFSHLSVVENIMLAPMNVLGMSRADAHDIALELLGKVRIPEKADAYPDEISGGQQQRVAIARSLAMKPKVMADLSSEGMTSLVVTHEMGFARRAADRIVFMEKGEIIENASNTDFFGGAVNPRTRHFLDQILH
jgi:polar amino acid transport system ATP-binding protein